MDNGILYENEQKTAGKVNFNSNISNSYAVNEAYKTLRTNIMFSSSNIKKIVVTSTQADEGKSTVCNQLARSLTEIGKKTLLIDADMRNSVILRHSLKSQNILGLSELLSGQASINQVLYNTQNPDFNIIFSGRFPPNPVELLSSLKFSEILDEFSKEYDYIIIDSPPLNPVIDAAIISANCDGVILVVTPGKTKYKEANLVKEQILKSGSKIIGVVLNETDKKHRDMTRSAREYYYQNK